jgi:TonB family protein
MFGPDVLQDVTLSVGTLEETVIVSRGPEPVSDAPWPTSPRNLAGCSHDWAIAEVETDEAGAAGPRVRVGGNIVPPMKTHHVTPRYPRGANVEGTVVLDGVITADGVMDKLEVVGEADPELESATVAAVRDWTYSSTRLNGVPIPAWMRVTVHFRNP